MDASKVEYYFRGIQEGKTVYSRKNEYPWMIRIECQRDAIRDGKKAVFVNELNGNSK
jgi:hypothetical protein